jgi:hypothetical protein
MKYKNKIFIAIVLCFIFTMSITVAIVYADWQKMDCGFIYSNSNEPTIKRCYDKETDNYCYLVEDYKSISCVPNHVIIDFGGGQ